MILATTNINIIPDSGIWHTIFYQTWMTLNIFGLFGANGFTFNLAGLIIIVVVGLAAAGITERLAGEKPGKNLLSVVLLTLLGAYIFAAFVKLPFELRLDNVPLVAALLGAIVFGVFFVLIRKTVAPNRSAAH